LLTWEIANEYLGNEAFQDAAGSYFAAHDPSRRPVITSDGTTDDAAWPDKPWVGMAVNHSCTSSTPRHGLRRWYLAVARNTRAHGKPAWCNESGREKRHQNDDGVHRRKQGWLWNAAGASWTHHSWDGCEGIDDAAYQAPGEEFLRPMADFFQGLPFWTLSPTETAIVAPDDALVSAALASPDRGTSVAYACTEGSGETVKGAALTLRLPAGRYEARFVRPSDNTTLGTREVQSAEGLKETVSLPLPEFTDDVAVVVTVRERWQRRRIPGTE